MNAFCNSCGSPLAPAARFCSACGTVVPIAPPPGAAPFYNPPPRLIRPIVGRQFAGVCAAFGASSSSSRSATGTTGASEA